MTNRIIGFPKKLFGTRVFVFFSVTHEYRVARWYIFKPKIQLWVIFGGSCHGTCCHVLWTIGLFYNHLVYFMDIWYISWSFGMIFPILVCCTKKNLAMSSKKAPEPGSQNQAMF
jgi:hypothetical protein